MAYFERAVATGIDEVLDHPVWSALTSRHAAFSLGDASARRYQPGIVPFIGVEEATQDSLAAAAFLVQPNEQVTFFGPEPVDPPASLVVIERRTALQMEFAGRLSGDCSTEVRSLDRRDVPAMLELVDLAKPGAFGPRSIELGEFLGVHDGERLVAMVGERMKVSGATEITALCTHPDYRRRGYSKTLLGVLTRRIADRNERAFLHVSTAKSGAIALHESQGFVVRKTFHSTIVTRTA
jgi:predicted GNAT family acetyltransferase